MIGLRGVHVSVDGCGELAVVGTDGRRWSDPAVIARARDELADERDALADERDESANERNAMANERDELQRLLDAAQGTAGGDGSAGS